MPPGKSRLPFTLRYPRRVLGAAVIAIAALGMLGSGVEERLTPTSLGVPGTPSAQGGELLSEHFGESAPFAVLLQGPAAALDRQGPALIRSLRAEPAVTTLSPWDGAQLSRLRPGPRRALILVDFHTTTATAVEAAVPALNETLAREIRAPVRATQTGYASLSRAIQNESISSTEKAELIAIPFLLIVLLLVFRSPVAAIIPLAFGAITVVASRGALFLASGQISIDAFALTVATMMGLALGVDYALLMVSRFREELALGKDPADAAHSTRRTAGRTTLFAGVTLFVSMAVSVFVLPGSLLLSLAGTAIMVTAISLITSIYLAPPLLSLLGPNVDRWHLSRSGPATHNTLHALLQTALRRPAPVAIAISGGLLLLAAPALAIKTGPPSAKQLPPSSPARADAERVSRQIGPGWDAPFVLVAATHDGPITSAADLRHLAKFQDLLARQPRRADGGRPEGDRQAHRASAGAGGSGLLGPPGERRARPAAGPGAQARARRQRRRPAAHAASPSAADGAGLLGEGSGRAQAGAAKIASGLERAADGGAKATAAIERLADGLGPARRRPARRPVGLALARPRPARPAAAAAQGLAPARPGTALAARRPGQRRPDPEPAAAKAGILVRALAAARGELRSLRNDAARLDAGMVRLVGGGTSSPTAPGASPTAPRRWARAWSASPVARPPSPRA